MRTCPQCARPLGLATEGGYCCYVCRAIHKAHRKRERQKRFERWLLDLPIFRRRTRTLTSGRK